MAVTAFQDLPLADRDREWDGDLAEKHVRAWAGAEDGPNAKYRDAPMLLIGEGTSEIQKTIIARGLLARYRG